MCGEVRHTERRQRHGQRCAYRRSGRGFVLYTLVLYTFLEREPNNRADCNFCGLPYASLAPCVLSCVRRHFSESIPYYFRSSTRLS